MTIPSIEINGRKALVLLRKANRNYRERVGAAIPKDLGGRPLVGDLAPTPDEMREAAAEALFRLYDAMQALVGEAAPLWGSGDLPDPINLFFSQARDLLDGIEGGEGYSPDLEQDLEKAADALDELIEALIALAPGAAPSRRSQGVSAVAMA